MDFIIHKTHLVNIISHLLGSITHFSEKYEDMFIDHSILTFIKKLSNIRKKKIMGSKNAQIAPKLKLGEVAELKVNLLSMSK